MRLTFRRLAIVFACIIFGCDKSASPPQPSPKLEEPQATAARQSTPPASAIRYLGDESKLFAKRMAADAFVYEFPQSSVEVWLEYETNNGQSERSDPLKLDHLIFNQQTMSETTCSIVAWGQKKTEMNVRLSWFATQTDGESTQTARYGQSAKLRIPPIPPMKPGGHFLATTTSTPSGQLTGETNEEFVVLSYEWGHEIVENGSTVMRKVVVRLKGKRLPDDDSHN